MFFSSKILKLEMDCCFSPFSLEILVGLNFNFFFFVYLNSRLISYSLYVAIYQHFQKRNRGGRDRRFVSLKIDYSLLVGFPFSFFLEMLFSFSMSLFLNVCLEMGCQKIWDPHQMERKKPFIFAFYGL